MGSVNQIATMRLPNGQEVAFVDWNDKPLYSTVDLLTGFTDTAVQLFTYVPGDPVSSSSNVTSRRTATDGDDTNLSTPGSMASTEEMLVYAIRPQIVEYQNSTDTDANTRSFVEAGQPLVQAQRLAVLQADLQLSLRVSQKIMHRANLAYYNFGAGPFGVGAVGGAAPAMGFANQGLPSQEAVRSLTIPIHIGGQEKYRVSLENPLGKAVLNGLTTAGGGAVEAGTMHSMRVYLDGLYKRPVA
jgi:hypothetical protein